MTDYPRVIARFHPQAWVNDQAISVDAEGDTEWDVTLEIMNGDADEEWADDNYPSDDLHRAPTAPKWIREWGGPFYVEVAEAVAEWREKMAELDSSEIETMRSALAAERAALPPSDPPLIEEIAESLADLVEWGDRLGGWDNPAWYRAKHILRRYRGEPGLPVVDGDEGDLDIYGYATSREEAMRVAEDNGFADPVVDAVLSENVTVYGITHPKVWVALTPSGAGREE